MFINVRPMVVLINQSTINQFARWMSFIRSLWPAFGVRRSTLSKRSKRMSQAGPVDGGIRSRPLPLPQKVVSFSALRRPICSPIFTLTVNKHTRVRIPFGVGAKRYNFMRTCVGNTVNEIYTYICIRCIKGRCKGRPFAPLSPDFRPYQIRYDPLSHRVLVN